MFTLKLLGASALAVLIAFGAGYYKGHVACSEAAQVRQLQAERDMLRRVIERRDRATAADQAQAEIDRAEREALAEANRNLQNELQDPDRECLGPRDTERLRELWR
jgi:tRNA U54 and U55 pseudouridine synthase Pus10